MTKSREYIRICKKCGAKCCKLGGPTLTENELKKILNKGYKNYAWRVKDRIYELKSKKGRCPYLKKDNSCEIQDVKPLVCVSWPVFPETRNNKQGYVIYKCPLTNMLSKEDIRHFKNNAKNISKSLLNVAMDYSTAPKSQRYIIKKRMLQFKKKTIK